jgi:ABC-type sugar transport system ATPase subunit
VTKRFGGQVAVDGVDFDLRAGEVHALVGENGAGKSTLVKMLDGYHRPDEGTLLVGEEEVRFASVRDAEHAGVAMIPQELDLFGELSVAENLVVGRNRPRRPWGGMTGRRSGRRRASASRRSGSTSTSTRPSSSSRPPTSSSSRSRGRWPATRAP